MSVVSSFETLMDMEVFLCCLHLFDQVHGFKNEDHWECGVVVVVSHGVSIEGA